MRGFKPTEPKYRQRSYSHRIVAVDLGKWKVGVSVWLVSAEGVAVLEGARTVRCRRSAQPDEVSWAVRRAASSMGSLASGELPQIWVCEWPVKRPHQRSKHKDIQALQDVGYALGRSLEGWDQKYRPGEWKGNISKQAHHKRLQAALSTEELTRCPPLREHDAWDAIGLGLFAVARTRRGGAKP